MKIVILSTISYPSPSANRVHLMEMVQAFDNYGCDVNFLCKKIADKSLPDKISVLPLATNKSFSSAWRFANFLKQEKTDFWFCREPHLLFLVIIFYFLLTFKRPPFIVYEIHDLPRDLLDTFTIKLLRLINKFHILTITNALAADIVDRYKVGTENISVFPDGVNLKKFTIDISRQEARKSLNLDLDKKTIVYTGSLFAWKGVYTMLKLAQKMPTANFVFVGGNKKSLSEFNRAANSFSNVIVPGYVEQDVVKQYLAAADVLILPNSAKYLMSKKYTSPLKMFEYMASRRPIVASDLPSIREILTNGYNACLVKPDDAEALLIGLEKTLSDKDNKNMINNAFMDVKKYSWENRVKKIMSVIKTKHEKMAN